MAASPSEQNWGGGADFGFNFCCRFESAVLGSMVCVIDVDARLFFPIGDVRANEWSHLTEANTRLQVGCQGNGVLMSVAWFIYRLERRHPRPLSHFAYLSHREAILK